MWTERDDDDARDDNWTQQPIRWRHTLRSEYDSLISLNTDRCESKGLPSPSGTVSSMNE
jgi:hypothetical protein